ncbi:hypothetical protein K445DRAFT_8220 [Daldinia sp. EC12]|nr:hypothetical protein F4774DRAFT_52119 [Daldinia eschscholtzii]OTB19159.1 hypothetical protein K445DRAFT_8220 [Daldinia sp. EC12]
MAAPYRSSSHIATPSQSKGRHQVSADMGSFEERLGELEAEQKEIRIRYETQAAQISGLLNLLDGNFRLSPSFLAIQGPASQSLQPSALPEATATSTRELAAPQARASSSGGIITTPNKPVKPIVIEDTTDDAGEEGTEDEGGEHELGGSQAHDDGKGKGGPEIPRKRKLPRK